MIDRRTMLGSSAAFMAATGLLRAQPQGRPARIAYLSTRPGPNEFEQAFERGLREHGWAPGAQLVLDYRFAGFDAERETAHVVAMMASRPDVIVVADNLIGRAARS